MIRQRSDGDCTRNNNNGGSDMDCRLLTDVRPHI